MVPLIDFIFYLVSGLLWLLIAALVVYAIMSWLIVFDVINTRNRAVYSVSRMLEAVTRPVLAPFRRVIPNLGGVDISFIVAFLVLQGVRGILLPPLHGFLVSAVS